MINEIKNFLWLYKDMNIDSPDEKDIPYEVLFWWENDNSNKIDERIVNKYITIFNQNEDRKTYMACWCYWIYHISNILNILEYWKQWLPYNEINPSIPWIEYLKENPQAQYTWSSLQTWLNKLTKNWLISWYTKLTTIEEWKNAIDSWRWIYTWSMNWDWNKVKTNKIYWVKDKSYWHLFCIYWYNDFWFLAINSYWKNDWIFTIPYEYWDTLYSRYAISDKKDLWDFSFYNNSKQLIDTLSLDLYSKAYQDISNNFWQYSKQARIFQHLWQKKFNVRVQEKIEDII